MCRGIWSEIRHSFFSFFFTSILPYNDKKGRAETKTGNGSRQEVTPYVCQYVLCQDVLNVWMEVRVKCSRASLVHLPHATKQRRATLKEHPKRTAPIPTEVRQTCSSLCYSMKQKALQMLRSYVEEGMFNAMTSAHFNKHRKNSSNKSHHICPHKLNPEGCSVEPTDQLTTGRTCFYLPQPRT